MFTKNCSFASFFKINLYLCPFSQFRLQIWNENKILRILVPILTYFNTKYFFQNTGQIFFSSNRSIWVPKNAEFYAYSKSEDEIEKKCTNKKLFNKNKQKNCFLIMTFLSRVLFKFCLQIWNQCKILRLLVPILTYLKKKVFSSNFWKIISGLYSLTLLFCRGRERGRWMRNFF